MKRKVILAVTALIIFCLSQGQFLISFAANSGVSINSSGIIKEKTVQPIGIRKHLMAYGLSAPLEEGKISSMAQFDLVNVDLHSAHDSPQQIKALDPNTTVIFYLDIMASGPTSKCACVYCGGNWTEIDAHEDWFLHDKNGNRLMNIEWNFYAMDVGNIGWQTYIANYVKNILDNYPALDGVFFDDTWTTFRYSVWNVPAENIPTDIGTRWHNDMLEMIKFVKERIGDKLVIVNTSNNDDYVDACDGKMEEGFIHESWRSSSEWLRGTGEKWKFYVDRLRNICEKGKYFLAHSGTSESNQEVCQSVMLFCFTSYLLGVQGNTASFGWKADYSSDSHGYWTEFDEAKQLGPPTNDYYSYYSVYARDFENGKVLVNPSTSSYIISLGQNYRTLDGQVISSVTLDNHTGIILLEM
jgi:hypothetical protein